MTQKEYRALNTGHSQRAIIYRMLLDARGEWVPLQELMRVSRSAHVRNRASELRKLGVTVLQRGGRDADSRYRIPLLTSAEHRA